MDTNNNQLPDINVGNLNFQPMPKRFIAWDKRQKHWVTKFLMPSTSYEDSDDWTCPLTLGVDSKGQKNWLNNDQLIICQSTNLFDKDGREIFEGSVVEFRGNKRLVVFKNGCFIIDNSKLGFFETGWSFNQINLWNNDNLLVRIIGHILSNPELMEKR